MQDIPAVKVFLQSELARAEFVLADANSGNKKAHQPTVEYFRGQADLIRRILAYAEEDIDRQSRGDVLEWYCSARADGWECEAYEPDGDHWEHALLQRENCLAEIDLLGGRVTLWRNGQLERPTFPYSWLL